MTVAPAAKDPFREVREHGYAQGMNYDAANLVLDVMDKAEAQQIDIKPLHNRLR